MPPSSQLGTIREAIASCIRTAIGDDPIGVHARIPDGVNPPYIAVWPRRGRLPSHRKDERYVYTFEVVIALAKGWGTDALQQRLDEYLDLEGDRSIVAALDADPTLGGLVNYVVNLGFEEYATEEDANGVQLLGARLGLEIGAKPA